MTLQTKVPLLQSHNTEMRVKRIATVFSCRFQKSPLWITDPFLKRCLTPKWALGSLCSAGLLLLYTLSVLGSQPPNLSLEAELIWGTNAKSSPNGKHKPVDAELRKKLQALPLKWTNYFEIKRVKTELPSHGVQRIPLSDKCELELTDRGQSKIEVTHFGNGKRIGTRTQTLPKGETLILGGNAPGETSWLVVLRRLQ